VRAALAVLALAGLLGSSILVAATQSSSPSPSASASRSSSPAPEPAPSSTPTKKPTSPPSPSAARTPTASEREALAHVTFCFTDNLLFGFCEPPTEGRRRIADRFNVYVTPHNATVTYRILLDEKPLKLASGKPSRTTNTFLVEHLAATAARRVHLEVEIQVGNATPVVTDWGTVQVRKLESVLDDEDNLRDRIEGTIRQFTQTEWTWYNIRTGLVGLAAIGLAAFAALQRRREKLENERPAVVAY